MCLPVCVHVSHNNDHYIRIQQLSESEGVIIMYHFVSGNCFSNSEITIIYRRFMQKVLFIINFL